MNPALRRALQDRRIGSRHRLRSVLLFLSDRATDAHGWIQVKHGTIARGIGTDRSHISQDLRQLIHLGYLESKQDPETRFFQYRFAPCPQCAESAQVRIA